MDQLGGKIKKVGATSPLSHGLAYADTLDKIMLLDIAVFFGCESSPISRNVRSLVSQLVS